MTTNNTTLPAEVVDSINSDAEQYSRKGVYYIERWSERPNINPDAYTHYKRGAL